MHDIQRGIGHQQMFREPASARALPIDSSRRRRVPGVAWQPEDGTGADIEHINSCQVGDVTQSGLQATVTGDRLLVTVGGLWIERDVARSLAVVECHRCLHPVWTAAALQQARRLVRAPASAGVLDSEPTRCSRLAS